MLTGYVNAFGKTKSFIKTDIQIELSDGLKALYKALLKELYWKYLAKMKQEKLLLVKRYLL